MQPKVYTGKYKDKPCVVLENERIMVKVTPQYGSKIQSIYDKEKQKEYLYQATGVEYKESQYGSVFEHGEFSGFDEMFPSIAECFYPSWPWKGIMVPDHGEVWSVPWDWEIHNSSLVMSVHGVRFPYVIEKTVNFSGNSTVHLSYRLNNLSKFEFEFIWAAHPLFNCIDDMVIVLPPSVKKVFNVESGDDMMGSYGEIHPWPETVTADGHVCDISKIRPESSEKYRKYYVHGAMTDGWCEIHDTKTGEVIRISFPEDKVPFLGMWINEGGYYGQYNVAPEPCTGAPDRIDAAKEWGRLAVVKGRSVFKWYLDISFYSQN